MQCALKTKKSVKLDYFVKSVESHGTQELRNTRYHTLEQY